MSAHPETCPTCGRGPRGSQARLFHVRRRKCVVCGQAFEQFGPGRSRVLCGSEKCRKARCNFNRRGGDA